MRLSNFVPHEGRRRAAAPGSEGPGPEPIGGHASERAALMRVAAAAAAAGGIDDVVELAAEAALELLPPGSLSVRRWDPERGEMRTLINVGRLGPGEERRPPEEGHAPGEDSPAHRLLRFAKPYFTAVDDPDAHAGVAALLRARGKESCIGVAIVVEGSVWGELWAATVPGGPRFRARDVRFLEAIAAQLARVIARAERFTTAARLAFEDQLTGVGSRALLLERLEGAMEAWREQGTASVLMLCDVDDLAQVNSGRGHRAGDRVLQRVAETLTVAAAPLPGAVIGRMTGDEFGVLLEGGSLDDARELVAAAIELLEGDRDAPVTLSWGAAVSGPHVSTSLEILRAADSAQYAARRRGGSRLCTAEAAPAAGASPRRRRRRRRHGRELLDEASTRLLGLLDGELAARSTLSRLELVACEVAESLDVAAWAISFAGHGASAIRPISAADGRDGRLAGLRVRSPAEVHSLEDSASAARLVQAGTGTLHVDRHDADAGAAERELLARLGFSSVLAVAVADPDGVYLLELYGDGDTLDLRMADVPLALLARAAAARSAGTTERSNQLEKRTRQLAVTADLGARLVGATETAAIVDAAADALSTEFDSAACAVLRLSDEGSEVEIAGARGEAMVALKEAGWSQGAALGLVGRTLREAAVIAVGDVTQEPDHRAIAETLETRSQLCAPLWAGDRLWGAIDIEHPGLHAFDGDDAKLLQTVCDQVSAALGTAHLYEQLERDYLGTAEALGAALEAKDAYTARHSRNLAKNAEAVGRALGMDEEELRQLRFAAAFHDIGKLAIPEAILNKPGRLDAAERARIEQHTVIGERILAPIEFLADVRPLVRHGHERWDGRGYPDRLAGEAIPLGARIVFACDAFDAMTSDRPYRSALPFAVARAELARNAGSQFDPDVVDALLAVLDGPGSPGG